MFPCTLMSSYGHSLIRSFNWITAIVPVYKHQGRIHIDESMSDYTTAVSILKRSPFCVFLPSM